MRPHHALSAFITADPEESLTKKTATILLPRATIGTTAFLALTALTAAGHGPLPQQLAEALATHASDYARVNIQAAVHAGIFLYAGVTIVMSIMERLLKPLIAAGEARGETRGEARGKERGKAEAQADFEAWKQDQLKRGAIFVEENDEKEASLE